MARLVGARSGHAPGLWAATTQCRARRMGVRSPRSPVALRAGAALVLARAGPELLGSWLADARACRSIQTSARMTDKLPSTPVTDGKPAAATYADRVQQAANLVQSTYAYAADTVKPYAGGRPDSCRLAANPRPRGEIEPSSAQARPWPTPSRPRASWAPPASPRRARWSA